jgi:succinylarginine dihydrolase
MTTTHYANDTAEAMRAANEQKQAALRLMLDVFEEAEMDGIDPDCMAQAALFTALKEFVSAYGEEPMAKFAERLPERIRNGEFTVQQHS